MSLPRLSAHDGERVLGSTDPSWFVPFVETSTAEALPWAKTGATHSFPHIPPPESYGPIVEEFARVGPPR